MRTLALILAAVVAATVCAWLIVSKQSQPAAIVAQPKTDSKRQVEEMPPPDRTSAQTMPETPPLQVATTPKQAAAGVSAPVQPTPSTPFSQAMELLVSPQAGFQEKQAAWKQLREAGELDHAIDFLRQGAAGNPTSSEYPAALGQAELQKAGVIAQSGGSISEMGMLGMQADKDFDTALKVDPTNWEAQFFKAAAMSHWPAELNKGQEVIQRLSNLIDQQESGPAKPEFAQAYLLLGDQYAKAGQTDHAQAAWRLGLAKFPSERSLLQKLGNP